MVEFFKVTPKMAERICNAKGVPAVQASIINAIFHNALKGWSDITPDVMPHESLLKEVNYDKDFVENTLNGMLANKDICSTPDFGWDFKGERTYCLSTRVLFGILVEAEKNNSSPVPARTVRALAQMAGGSSWICVRPEKTGAEVTGKPCALEAV